MNIAVMTFRLRASWVHSLKEKRIDYEYSMDGKLLVSLIIGREVAKHIGGIAVAYYE